MKHTIRVRQAVLKKAEAGLVDAAPMLITSARRIVPVDTGRLQRSIEAAYSLDGLTLFIGSRVPYAGYVEIGTPKMSAQPYLRPALMENKGNLRRLFKAL